MQTCNAFCAVPLPAPYADPCAIRPRPGGISRFVMLACDVAPETLANPTALQAAIAACKIRISPEVVGQKPQGSFEKKHLSSCRPEQIVAGEKTITFRDYTTDAAGQFRDFDFWNTLLLNPSRYNLGWLTCDGTFYGFVPFTLEVDEVIEDTRNGQAYKEGTFTIEHLGLIKPTPMPPGAFDLLMQHLNTPCAGGGGELPPSFAITTVTPGAEPGSYLLGIPPSAVGACAGPFSVALFNPSNTAARPASWDVFVLSASTVATPTDTIPLLVVGVSSLASISFWLAGCDTEVLLSLDTSLLT